MRICTVVVTYNRKNLLLRCINKCLSQSINTDILIFDNCSTDGTYDYLKENGILDDKRVIYYYSKENIGGAGGFSNGLKKAYDLGYDFFWLMDDDGYPIDENALGCIVECYKSMDKNYIFNSIVLSENDFSRLSFSTGGFQLKKDFIDKSQNGVYEGAISPFNGTFISRSIVEIIGFPKEDFFIKGDETEYICRAKKKGFKVATVCKSEFSHPEMPIKIKKILFLKLDLGEENYWKEYYKARNYVFIYKNYFNRIALWKFYIYTRLKCLFYEDDKKRKRKYTKLGLKDGRKNKFGKIKF